MKNSMEMTSVFYIIKTYQMFKSTFSTTYTTNSSRPSQSSKWKALIDPEINREYHRIKLGHDLECGRRTESQVFS